MNSTNSFILFADESGDHGLSCIDPSFPVFVLVFCIFEKKTYINHISTGLQYFKFKHFGYDTVILHSREIRKAENSFLFLKEASKKKEFMNDLNIFIDDASFTIISITIHKTSLKDKYSHAFHPYHLAMCYGLEKIYQYLVSKNDLRKTHIIFESRGKKEDAELVKEFNQICLPNQNREALPFQAILANKMSNSAGLQLADLAAYPIARYALNPQQENKSFLIIKKKLYQNSQGLIDGFGLTNVPTLLDSMIREELITTEWE